MLTHAVPATRNLLISNGLLASGENPDHSDGGSHAPENCTINWVSSYDDLARVLTSGWQRWAWDQILIEQTLHVRHAFMSSSLFLSCYLSW